MNKNDLHFLLGMIGESSVKATIQGVEMELINQDTRKGLLEKDPKQRFTHECVLEYGTFIYIVDKEFTLKRLYKVIKDTSSDIDQPL